MTTCDVEFTDVEIHEMESAIEAEKSRTFRITHHYDIGNQDVFVERAEGDVNGLRAALFCWFKACEWFGDSAMVSNLGIASLLVTFYGFRHCAVSQTCTTVDLYADAERVENYDALMSDPSLDREGLRAAMQPHVSV